jgi:hypothetical protein
MGETARAQDPPTLSETEPHLEQQPHFHDGPVHHSTAAQKSETGIFYSHDTAFTIPTVKILQANSPAEELPPWVQAMETTAQNSSEDWPQRPHISIKLDLQPAADYTQYLLDHALICYFTSQCPRLEEFSNWVDLKFANNCGWPISHVKFCWQNFYMVLFDSSKHRQAAISVHPWFYQRKFLYVFEWEPDFDVSTGQYSKLPVWVEIPYRSLILEPYRMRLATALGQVLLYLQGREHSSYPHDRACILWDLNI